MILREFFVMLGLELDEASFAKGQLAAALVEKGLEKLVEIAKETVEEFVNMVKETAEAGHQIEELSKITGIGTDSLQDLMTAAEFSNVATGALSHGIGVLARNMYAVKTGSEEASKVFHKLGVKVKDQHGKLRGTDEVLLDLADRFKEMPDGAEKTALAMQALGRAGKEMIPLLNEGREGIEELAKATPNLTEEQIAASKDLVKTQKELTLITKNLWQRAIAPLLPAIDKLLRRYLQWRKANGEIMRQRIEKYVGLVIKAIEGLIEVFNFLVKNVYYFATAALGYLIIQFNILSVASVRAGLAMSRAWLAAAAPIAGILIAVGSLLIALDDLRVFLGGGDSLLGRFQKQLQEWMQIQPDDPWFVKALKEFLQLINDAIDELKHLADWLGISDKIERQYNQARLKDQEARETKTKSASGREVTVRHGKRVIGDLGQLEGGRATGSARINRVVGPGGSVYTGEEALKQTKNSGLDRVDPAFGPRFDPSIAGAARGATRSSVYHIKIDANGMTPEQAKPMIKQVLREHEDETNEDAAASFPAVP